MDTPDQETSRHKLMKSELISHQLKSPQKKTRSNSFNGDLEQEEKSSNEEVSAEKMDFKQLRNRFEKLDKPIVPPKPAHLSRKRTSMPGNAPTFNQTLAETLSSTLPRNTTRSSAPFIKARSSSPPDPLNSRPNSSTPRMILKNNLHTSIDEEVLGSSTDSEYATIPEDDIDDPPKSVQSIRAFFNEQKNFPLNPLEPTNRSVSIPGKLIASALLSIPPPVLSRSPERYIKSQLHDTHSMPSVETVDSITGDSSLSSNQNLSASISSDASFTDEDEDSSGERRIKLRRCLEEVYTTEKTYVNILYVLSAKLSSEVKNTCDTKDENLILTFNNTYRSLLGNIQQIYRLHHEHILPEMEQYIDGHLTGNMWSTLKKNFKVIEVLYKDYYVTYYDTQGKLDELCKTQPLINEAMVKCQSYLGNLYPITQLNCPNQRLLRYILCLKTYLKYLDQRSEEYKYTREVHDELDRIAVRCEEELVVSAAQLNELYERLDNKFECIRENRKLIWHGPVKKQSPRKHLDIAQRYVILFSDRILVCGEESGRKLEIKRQLTLQGVTIDVLPGGRASVMQTTEQISPGLLYYPFRVNAVEKSYEFLTDKESEREIWVRKMRQASDDYSKRNTNIEIRQSGTLRREEQLGIRAPAWVNDVDVTRCQNCNNRFRTTIILSRRHHCRSCGRCVCGSCSTKKLSLEYCKSDNEVRVCDTCFTRFTGTVLSKNTSIWPKPTREVDETILFGDFRAVHSGSTVWIALQEDYQFHVYGGKLDQAEDYAIKLAELLEVQLEPDTRTYTLREITKTHVFTIDSNHQIIYQKNDLLDEKLKNSETKLTFYSNLWFEAIQLARSTTLPEWYVRKRDSADSGVSNTG